MSPRIGIMQGRLSKPLNNKIQSFPVNSWENEFYLAKDIGFKLIEWVLDENIKDNPILNKKFFSKIEMIKKKTGIDINSMGNISAKVDGQLLDNSVLCIRFEFFFLPNTFPEQYR